MRVCQPVIEDKKKALTDFCTFSSFSTPHPTSPKSPRTTHTTLSFDNIYQHTAEPSKDRGHTQAQIQAPTRHIHSQSQKNGFNPVHIQGDEIRPGRLTLSHINTLAGTYIGANPGTPRRTQGHVQGQSPQTK